MLGGLAVGDCGCLHASSGGNLILVGTTAAGAADGVIDLPGLGTVCNELHAQSRQPGTVWER